MKNIKIYYTLSEESEDIPIIDVLSLQPLKECYILDLTDNKPESVLDMDWKDLVPYNGACSLDRNTLYYSKDGKHFLEEGSIPDKDWEEYYSYNKIGIYKEGNLVKTKYEEA